MHRTQPIKIGILGSGLLHAAIGHQLEDSAEVISLGYDDLMDLPQSYSLLLMVEDTWNSQAQQQVNSYSLQSQTPWLRVCVEADKVILGPLTIPWHSGCATCADLRRADTQKDVEQFISMRTSLVKFKRPDITTFVVQAAANLLALDVKRFLIQPESMQTCNALIFLALDTLAIHRHPFLREPNCPDCYALPADSADLAQIKLQNQLKIAPYTYRIRSLAGRKKQLQQRYVDTEMGMISAFARDNYNLYSNSSAFINLQEGRRKEIGYGRAFDFEQSYVSGIAEALERQSGMRPGSKRTVVRGSYNELSSQALNPRSLGLHTHEQYTLPNFPLVEYHDDLAFNWVWGYSFQRQQPILVPERYIFYGLTFWTKERSFVYEISNGWALGSSLEEAILHGILELAERDAFLMTWYTQMPMPRIDPYSSKNPQIPLMLERLYYLTGYTVHAFNITMEQGIPCFWVMGVDEQNRSDMPKALCAGGSKLHPDLALINAIQELATMIGQHKATYKEERPQALQMLASSSAVTQMHHHSLLYCLPRCLTVSHFSITLLKSKHLRKLLPLFTRKRRQWIYLMTSITSWDATCKQAWILLSWIKQLLSKC